MVFDEVRSGVCVEGVYLSVNKWLELKRVTKQENKCNLAGWIPLVWSSRPLQSSVLLSELRTIDVCLTQVFKGDVSREDKIRYNVWLEIIVNVMNGRKRFPRSLMRFSWYYERYSLFDPNRSIMSHAVLAEEPSRPV